MRSHTRLLLPLLLVLFVGCPRPATPAPPKNLVEWFKQKNVNAETPEGFIDMDSVSPEGEDTVVYETTKDGVRKKWKQKFEKSGKGAYRRLGELEEITEMK